MKHSGKMRPVSSSVRSTITDNRSKRFEKMKYNSRGGGGSGSSGSKGKKRKRSITFAPDVK